MINRYKKKSTKTFPLTHKGQTNDKKIKQTIKNFGHLDRPTDLTGIEKCANDHYYVSQKSLRHRYTIPCGPSCSGWPTIPLVYKRYHGDATTSSNSALQ